MVYSDQSRIARCCEWVYSESNDTSYSRNSHNFPLQESSSSLTYRMYKLHYARTWERAVCQRANYKPTFCTFLHHTSLIDINLFDSSLIDYLGICISYICFLSFLISMLGLYHDFCPCSGFSVLSAEDTSEGTAYTMQLHKQLNITVGMYWSDMISLS